MLVEHRRHHSGDSLASQSSTSTQLSISQHSQSSDHKQDLVEPPSIATANQRTPLPSIANQHSAQLPTPNQRPSEHSMEVRQHPALATPQTNALPVANHIPTVVETVANRSTDTPPGKPSFPANIAVNVGDCISAPTVASPTLTSPLPAAAATGKKTRKRRRSTASTDSRHSSTTDPFGQYKCLWEGCGYGFTSCSLLRKHVSKEHTNKAGACVWAGCDRVERKRWALVSHVIVSFATKCVGMW